MVRLSNYSSMALSSIYNIIPDHLSATALSAFTSTTRLEIEHIGTMPICNSRDSSHIVFHQYCTHGDCPENTSHHGTSFLQCPTTSLLMSCTNRAHRAMIF